MSKQTDETVMSGRTQRLRGVQRTIARTMTAAWSAPVFHLTAFADVTGARENLATRGANLTDATVLACARALRDNPKVNAHYDDETITEFDQRNVGLAVDSPAGLMVPVLRLTDVDSLNEVSQLRRDIVERARSGNLSVSDMVDGTFTISNLGMFEVAQFDAIINPPQVAILAVGSAQPRIVRRHGQLIDIQAVALTLTCDHRALQGADGARFLKSVVTELEKHSQPKVNSTDPAAQREG